MIKLNRPAKPLLLEQNEAQLVTKYKATKAAVWKKDYIVEPLMKMSNNKCAYSEVKLGSKSNYVEVEHFRHKDLYPDEVVSWSNLLPSCKTCNDTKGTWDVVAFPIVDPTIDDPKDHLFISHCRFYKKTEVGDTTIKKVALNDRSQFVDSRSVICNQIIENIEYDYESLKDADTDLKKSIRCRKLKQSFKEGMPDKEFSATIATAITVEFPLYKEIIDYLKSNGYWDEDFKTIIGTLEEIALPPPEHIR